MRPMVGHFGSPIRVPSEGRRRGRIMGRERQGREARVQFGLHHRPFRLGRFDIVDGI